MADVNLDRVQSEEARWRILKVLDAGRPTTVSESIVFRVLHDIHLPLSPQDVRRELDYLERRGLLRLSDKDSPTWQAELTRHGIDVVEYTTPVEPGIARPPRG